MYKIPFLAYSIKQANASKHKYTKQMFASMHPILHEVSQRSSVYKKTRAPVDFHVLTWHW